MSDGRLDGELGECEGKGLHMSKSDLLSTLDGRQSSSGEPIMRRTNHDDELIRRLTRSDGTGRAVNAYLAYIRFTDVL
jgi:hypothetical protein